MLKARCVEIFFAKEARTRNEYAEMGDGNSEVASVRMEKIDALYCGRLPCNRIMLVPPPTLLPLPVRI